MVIKGLEVFTKDINEVHEYVRVQINTLLQSLPEGEREEIIERSLQQINSAYIYAEPSHLQSISDESMDEATDFINREIEYQIQRLVETRIAGIAHRKISMKYKRGMVKQCVESLVKRFHEGSLVSDDNDILEMVELFTRVYIDKKVGHYIMQNNKVK